MQLSPESEFEEILANGRQHLRRARIAATIAVVAIVGHFEYLVLAFARAEAGLNAMLLFGYPILLGVLAVAPLWGGFAAARSQSVR